MYTNASKIGMSSIRPSGASQVSLSEYDCQQVNKLDGIEDSFFWTVFSGWDYKSDLLLEHLLIIVC